MRTLLAYIHSTAAAAEATTIYHIRILQHIINVFNIIRRSKTQVKMEYTMSGIYNIMVPCILCRRPFRTVG